MMLMRMLRCGTNVAQYVVNTVDFM